MATTTARPDDGTELFRSAKRLPWLVVAACVLFLPTGVAAAWNYAAALRSPRSDPAHRHHMARARQWGLYSATVGVTVFTILVVVGLFVVNDAAVFRTFFAPDVLFPSFELILRGFWVNVQLFLVSEVTILAFALLIALMRELPGAPAAPLRFLSLLYTDVFRSLPEILVLLIIGLGLPRTGLPVVSDFNSFQAAWMALTLTYAAYVSEVMRAGLHSVHWSQYAAARSVGLTYLQAMRLVVFPLAFRNVVPPLLNAFISLQKGTALVSLLGVLDAMNYAQNVSSFTASLAPFTGVAICYLVITIPLTRLTDYLEERNRRRMLARS